MNKSILKNTLLKAMSTGADFADIFIEHTVKHNLIYADSKLSKAGTSIVHGAGIRLCHGDNTYYDCSNNTDEGNLIKMAGELSSSISDKIKVKRIVLKDNTIKSKHPAVKRSTKAELSTVKKIMKEIDKYARGYSKLVSQVEIMILDSTQNVIIANSEGNYVRDERIRTRLFIDIIASDGNNTENAIYNEIAGHAGYELFDNIDAKKIGVETAKKAVKKLYADECPSGSMPVIIGNSFGGVLFHEACVHNLEADALISDCSIFKDKLNTKIASDILTLVDDGTIKNMWGSSTIDDDGEPTKRNFMIKDGILNSYLVDKQNGKRLKMPSTGSSRREDYKNIPTARMNNTHALNGKSTIDEMIKSIDYGLYAKDMIGGSVNQSTCDFNFAVAEAYMIKNGRIDKQVKGASLIGNGADILKKIEMIGNDFDYGIGTCGAASGIIPVTVGQPSIKISNMTVGGRKKDV